MEKRIGFYAGSFDPFTVGHLLVVKKALELFDVLVIGLAYNPKKQRKIDTEIMKRAIQQTLESEKIDSRCKVISYGFPTLTYKVAKAEGASHMVRGLRNNTDYEYEEDLAKANKKIGNFETIYFRSDPEVDHISSSIVMELFLGGEDISDYVPTPVLNVLKKYYKM